MYSSHRHDLHRMTCSDSFLGNSELDHKSFLIEGTGVDMQTTLPFKNQGILAFAHGKRKQEFFATEFLKAYRTNF